MPRAIVVEFDGAPYLFDCQFDPELDDYQLQYTVYRLPEDLRDDLERMSWTDLGHRGQRVGAVDVSAVGFDPTRRSSIDARVFDLLR
ncbi:MAG TPA: hypothetical protein VGO78_04725 [Acidimicrobiales bacterium]|nr:hypothetical protein [Acidimicrobiales bacterium]